MAPSTIDWFPVDACFWAIVDGIPVSRQSKSSSRKTEWRAIVSRILRKRWALFCAERDLKKPLTLPSECRVDILMVRFESSALWDTGQTPDVDNGLDKSTLDAFVDAEIIIDDSPAIVAGRNARALALDKPFILSGGNAPRDAIATVARKIGEQQPFIFLKMTKAAEVQRF